jgi:hypothetical protein
VQMLSDLREVFQLIHNKELLIIVGLPLLADMIKFMFTQANRSAMSAPTSVCAYNA